jgi:hypothetical protein
MFLEYLTNMYVLPLIAAIIGIAIVFIYDKFEKKQYTNSVYLRIGILIYVSCLATIYISKLEFLQVGGGSSTNNIETNSQSFMPQPNSIRTNNFEHFKTGVPTF